MRRELRFAPTASDQLSRIENDPSLKGVLKQVRKTLGYLETDLRAKSLRTHEFESLTKRNGRKVFAAHVQQNTPGAYRTFWHYGPDEMDGNGKRMAIITVVAITPHPES